MAKKQQWGMLAMLERIKKLQPASSNDLRTRIKVVQYFLFMHGLVDTWPYLPCSEWTSPRLPKKKQCMAWACPCHYCFLNLHRLFTSSGEGVKAKKKKKSSKKKRKIKKEILGSSFVPRDKLQSKDSYPSIPSLARRLRTRAGTRLPLFL